MTFAEVVKDILWSNGVGFASALLNLIRLNVVLIIVFWLLRVAICGPKMDEHMSRMRMTDDTDGDVGLEPWSDSLYHSVMTQSTVGAADMVPTSRTMRILTGSQAVSTILTLMIIGTIALHHHHK